MDAKLMLLLPLGLPVLAVVVWFFFRLFNGRWADEADPRFAEPEGPVGLPHLTVVEGGRREARQTADQVVEKPGQP